MDLAALRDQLHTILFDSVMPFWLRHGIDPNGGLNTCLHDDGTLVSTDKWLWSQWRAVWVFSKLHNTFGREARWLDQARQIYQFVTRHGWDANVPGWVLCLDGDGNVLRGGESIYVDGFAIYGLAELLRATPDDGEVEGWARRTADAVLTRLDRPHSEIPTWPYPVPPGLRQHGLPMIFSLAFWDLGQALGEQRYRDAAVAMSEEIFSCFYRPERELVLERIGEDGAEAPPPLGTAVVPGHVIEDMWFQIHIALPQRDRRTIDLATRLIRRHCEIGWDDAFGGLLLAVDADGREQVGWDYATSKLWWPHTEAIYALILAHELTGEPWCLDWLQRVLDYALAHFPVPEHGEWTQRLTREGKPLTEVVALPVKDPFHLPRALILSLESLDRTLASEGAARG